MASPARFIVPLLVVLACSCTAYKGPRHYRVLGEQDAAAQRTLLVPKSFKVGIADFPSGTYVVAGADDDGYFYQAPQKVLIHFDMPGKRVGNGGIHIDKAGAPQAYIESEGTISFLPEKLPDTAFQITR